MKCPNCNNPTMYQHQIGPGQKRLNNLELIQMHACTRCSCVTTVTLDNDHQNWKTDNNR